MLTFRTLLLAHFQDKNGLGEIAKRLTYDAALGKLDGAPLRDELIRHDSDLKIPMWELWNFLPVWKTTVERLPAETRPWPEAFHTGEELANGEVTMLVEGFLLEGLNAIGALAGVAKTWFGLSLAAALTTDDRKFLGRWKVPERQNVLYLCPEMMAKTFRRRAEKFGLVGNSRFRCQTMEDGAIELASPTLRAASEELKPVIFLDTLNRYSMVENENSAADNRELANALQQLMRWGAKAVVVLHHSNKSAGSADEMTLENVLRGSGDIGAMLATCWGLRHARLKSDKNGHYLKESIALSRIEVRCVKPTDLPHPAAPFLAQLRPHLDERGEIGIISEDDWEDTTAEDVKEKDVDRLRKYFKANPHATQREAALALGVSQGSVSNWLRDGKGYQPPLKGTRVKPPQRRRR